MTDPATLIAATGAPNLAVDVGIGTAGRGDFVIGDSQLDGVDQLGVGNGSWVNVVCDVTDVHITRGATRLQGLLTRAEAGECVVTVTDTDRRLDPSLNGDAVHRGTPFRVRVWGTSPAPWSAVLFTGRIGKVAATYSRTDPPTVTVIASDAIGSTLAPWSSAGRADPGVGAGDDLADRVQRVLAEMGATTTIAADSDIAFLATLAPSNLAAGWDDITDAADAELGRVWVNAADELVLRARGSQLSGPIRGTLSDWHGEALDDAEVHCCYTDPAVVYGAEMLVNGVYATRRIPEDGTTPPPVSALVALADDYSRARYGPAVVDRKARPLELQTDAQLDPWARALLYAGTEPELRVDQVTPAPWGADDDGAAWRAVCATDIGDRWIFRLHPEFGPAVAGTVGVLGIEHTITPEGWETVWTTTEAGAGSWFTVGASVLDDIDLLAPALT